MEISLKVCSFQSINNVIGKSESANVLTKLGEVLFNRGYIYWTRICESITFLDDSTVNNRIEYRQYFLLVERVSRKLKLR